MNTEHTIRHSDFFYVAGIKPILLDSRWQTFLANERELLCFSNLSNVDEIVAEKTMVTIGQKHDNKDGIYCIVTINNESDLVSFETDMIGGVPVFWLSHNEISIVASSLGILITLAKNLKIKLRPNHNAFSELLVGSYVYSEMQTGVRNIQLLPPKSRLTINTRNGKVEVKKTAPEFTYEVNSLSWENAKLTFKKSLLTGFQKLKNKKVACLLSGGADSRIVAVSAVKSGIEPDFFTFGQSTINISDFYIANQVACKLNKKTKCFSTSAKVFVKNWKKSCSDANWINDSVWWAGRIPQEMFSELQQYDVIVRGDGDGIYGWQTAIANLSDIMHRLEISETKVARRFSKYFEEPDLVFTPAETSRNRLITEYKDSGKRLRDLTNILYQKIREPRGIAPGIWPFSKITAVDAPLLWEQLLEVASKTPRNKRYNKQIIFEVLKTFNETRNVPFSRDPSWDNQLEFYYTGVWEELLDYIKRYSPFPVHYGRLYRDYVRPSEINNDRKKIFRAIKRSILNKRFGRGMAFKYFSHLAHTSMSERLIIRLAIISNLCETLSKKSDKQIIGLPR